VDPDSHQTERQDPDPGFRISIRLIRIKVTNRIRIRIRINVMRNRNTGSQYGYRYLRYGTPGNVFDAFCINFGKFGHRQAMFLIRISIGNTDPDSGAMKLAKVYVFYTDIDPRTFKKELLRIGKFQDPEPH
jgi:hypothetical protein